MGRPVVVQVLPSINPLVDTLLSEEVEVRTVSRADRTALVDEAQDAAALIARVVDLPYVIDGPIFDQLPALQMVSASGSGADCFDIQAATQRGIPVLHNPGVAATPVVEYVLGAIVLLARNLLEHSSYLAGGGAWNDRRRFVGRQVSECTLGVVGIGAIGGEVARRAKVAFDMHVIGFDPVAGDTRFRELGVDQLASLDELIREADILSLHVPLLPTTRGLIGEAELVAMKRTAGLINASRGGVVDERALIAALRDGTIANAVIDVFDDEVPETDNPLFTMPNVLATPHCAGVSQRGLDLLARATARNLIKALAGERPPHLVNPEAWPPRRGVPS